MEDIKFTRKRGMNSFLKIKMETDIRNRKILKSSLLKDLTEIYF